MSTRSLFFLAIFGGLFAAEVVVWRQFLQAGAASASGFSVAALTHLGIAAGAALSGSSWLRQSSLASRITLAIFFAVVAAVLPLAGVLIVGAMGWIFSSLAGSGLRPEDKFVFGNPDAVAARRESREKNPEMRPLAESMRTLALTELEQLIHGVKHLQPHRLTQHFLRRFQTDQHSNLQFAAQGVISAASERLEQQLKTLTARIKGDNHDLEAHLGICEVLLELAAWTPQGDATAEIYRRDSVHHLECVLAIRPHCPRALLLLARSQVELDDSAAARATLTSLTKLGGDSDAARLLEMEARFRAGEFTALPALAGEIEDPPAHFVEALGFWSGACKPLPPLKPRAS